MSPVDEHRNPDDLCVPESMQKFIATKMSELIARRIKFVDVPKTAGIEKRLHRDHIDSMSAVRLLRDSKHSVGIDDESCLLDECAARPKQQKPTIKRRQIDQLPIQMNSVDRFNACSITIGDIRRETAEWSCNKASTKRGRRYFEYKSIKGELHLIEPETEFTKLRKKNNWSENKIKRDLK